MKTYKVNDYILYVPENYIEKIQGLIGKEDILSNGAMLLTNCNWVHTFFMRSPLKLYFLDKNVNLVKQIDSLKINRLSPIVFIAAHTLEFSVDTDKKMIDSMLLFLQQTLRT